MDKAIAATGVLKFMSQILHLLCLVTTLDRSGGTFVAARRSGRIDDVDT